jgi:pimeloyl-ACP methyl ester carboxylesterase
MHPTGVEFAVSFPIYPNLMMIITGTEDVALPAANSLILVKKIPVAWLVQIKDTSHTVPNQCPVEIGKILNTFLSTTTPPG